MYGVAQLVFNTQRARRAIWSTPHARHLGQFLLTLLEENSSVLIRPINSKHYTPAQIPNSRWDSAELVGRPNFDMTFRLNRVLIMPLQVTSLDNEGTQSMIAFTVAS